MSEPTCDCRLRPAMAEDGPTIKKMVRQAQLNPFGLDWRRFTVAVDSQEQIVGCVQIKTHGDGSRELASLVVVEELQDRGLGSRLVHHVQQMAGSPLWLMCRVQLTSYYERFGFDRVQDAAVMPAYFRRIFRVARLFYRLLRREMPLSIMRWTPS